MYEPNNRNGQAIELVKNMTSVVKDEVYRLIWHEHVKEDVLKMLEEKDLDKSIDQDDLADEVAGRYVYEGDYDCNQAYWNNLETLIEEVNVNDFKNSPKPSKEEIKATLETLDDFVKNNYKKVENKDDCSVQPLSSEYEGPEL